MVVKLRRERILFVVNCSLLVFIILLLLNLGGFSLPSVGKVRSLFDGEEPFCAVLYNGSAQSLDLNRCCLEARAQLDCIPLQHIVEDVRTDIACKTGASLVSYHLNFKARQYCSEQVIWP